MTILLTGVTGLVGARLLPRVLATGVACRVLVRDGNDVPDGATAVHGDVLDAGSLARAVKGVSAIVHLAAVFRTKDEDLIWKVNLDGTRHLIAAAKAHAPEARFIMASTAHVYGKGNARPGREDDVVAPDLAYPASKVAAEESLRNSGLNGSILRFGFVYGDQDGHLESLPDLATRAGFHPSQRMSMVHHRDIAAMVHLAMSGALDGHIVNVADDAPTSIYELAALVGRTVSPSSEPLADPWHLQMDMSLSRRLGFQPSVRTVHQAAFEGLL